MDERSRAAYRETQCGHGGAVDAREGLVFAVCGAPRLAGRGDEPRVAFEEGSGVPKTVDKQRLAAELAAFGPGTTEVFPVSAHPGLISLQYLVAVVPNFVRSQVADLFSLGRINRGISSQ